MPQKCFGSLEQLKTDERVALQNLIYWPNVWLYRKVTNNVHVYSRI